MLGVQTEKTTDIDGSLNVGFIDANDWMNFSNTSVNIPTSGTYTIEYRVSSTNGYGVLQFEKAGGLPQCGTISIPNTGGWQTWTIIKHTVTLTAGAQNFGIKVLTGGWNINWFSIAQGVKSASDDNESPFNLMLYPVPASNELTVSGLEGENNILDVFNLQGKLITQLISDEASEIRIDLSNLVAGIYILKVSNENISQILKFVKE